MLLNSVLPAAGNGSSVTIPIGTIVQGYLGHDADYVRANNSRYPLSEYPDIQPLLAAGVLPEFNGSVSVSTDIIHGSIDNSTSYDSVPFVDGDVIFQMQKPTSGNYGSLLAISTDGGATWRQSLVKATLAALYPEATVQVGTWANSRSLITGVCKLDSPGHYAALLIPQLAANSNLTLITTDDYGITWKDFYVVTGINSAASTAPIKLWYRNGVYLVSYTASPFSMYSIDGGQTWANLTSTGFPSNTLAYYGFLSATGVLQYPNGSAYIYLNWPATPAGWSSGLAMVNDAAKFPTTAQLCKQFGSIRVGWSTSTTRLIFLAYSPPPAAFTSIDITSKIPNLNSIIDIDYHNGYFYVLCNISSTTGMRKAIYTFQDAGSAVIGTMSLFGTDQIPSFLDPIGTLLSDWPIAAPKFGDKTPNTSGVIITHGRESIARLTAPSGPGNAVRLYSPTPTNRNSGLCYKYGKLFCNVSPKLTSDSGSALSDVSVLAGSDTLHFYTEDFGVTMVPIGRGLGNIYDAGTRLLRLSGAGILQQSQNGVDWNTSGITQPTNTTNVTAGGRIWGAGTAVYCLKYASGGDYTLRVSLDAGSSWSAVSVPVEGQLSGALRGNLTFWKGAYYLLMPYTSATSGVPPAASAVESVYVLRSTNGINFTTLATISGSAGSWNSNKAGFYEVGDYLAIYGGWSTASAHNGYISKIGKFFTGALSIASDIAASGFCDHIYNAGEHTYTYQKPSPMIPSTILTNVIGANWEFRNVIVVTGNMGDTNNAAAVTKLPDGRFVFGTSSGLAIMDPALVTFGVPTPATSGDGVVALPFMRVRN